MLGPENRKIDPKVTEVANLTKIQDMLIVEFLSSLDI